MQSAARYQHQAWLLQVEGYHETHRYCRCDVMLGRDLDGLDIDGCDIERSGIARQPGPRMRGPSSAFRRTALRPDRLLACKRDPGGHAFERTAIHKNSIRKCALAEVVPATGRDIQAEVRLGVREPLLDLIF